MSEDRKPYFILFHYGCCELRELVARPMEIVTIDIFVRIFLWQSSPTMIWIMLTDNDLIHYRSNLLIARSKVI